MSLIFPTNNYLQINNYLFRCYGNSIVAMHLSLSSRNDDFQKSVPNFRFRFYILNYNFLRKCLLLAWLLGYCPVAKVLATGVSLAISKLSFINLKHSWMLSGHLYTMLWTLYIPETLALHFNVTALFLLSFFSFFYPCPY